jgi:hypothetical protein
MSVMESSLVAATAASTEKIDLIVMARGLTARE